MARANATGEPSRSSRDRAAGPPGEGRPVPDPAPLGVTALGAAGRAGRRLPGGIKGLARSLIAPRYLKLMRAEPALRRAVPVLIIAFVASLGAAVVLQVRDARLAALERRADDLDRLVALVQARLQAAGPDGMPAGPDRPAAALQALPGGGLQPGLVLAVLGLDGRVAASLPESGLLVGAVPPGPAADVSHMVRRGPGPAAEPIPEPGPWGERFTAVAEAGPWRVVGQQTVKGALAGWRRRSLAVALFTGSTDVVLVLLGFAFYWQASRATQADMLYDAARLRLETALTHGRCGLWDWDLTAGRLFWSDSMFALLGYEPHEEDLTDAELARLMDGQGGFEALARSLRQTHAGDGASHLVDRRFRMRGARGEWLSLRARGELLQDPATGALRLIGIVMDETEERRFAEATEEADLRLREAIEALSEAFVLWDASSRLVVCNQRFQRLHQLPDALTRPGTHYTDVAEAGCQPVVRTQPAPDTRVERGARTFEVQLDDGRWLTINERRTRDGGYVSVGTDITSLKEQQERLMDGERRLVATIADLKRSRQALERQTQELAELADRVAAEKVRAEAANRAKSEFLANMSHELRTPLNVILGFSDAMASGTLGPLAPRHLDYCRGIHTSGRALLEIVDDVLEMARIDSGTLVLRPERVGLDRLLRDSLEGLRQEAEVKRLALSVDLAEGVEVTADRRTVRVMAGHLLANAIKFTPAGGRVGLRLRRRGDSVAFYVEDSGIGIPPEAIDLITQPFEQVQAPFTRSHRGSGLGLAIVRSLAELHGGSMRLRSRVGTGTVVMVTLPAGPLAALPGPGAALPGPDVPRA